MPTPRCYLTVTPVVHIHDPAFGHTSPNRLNSGCLTPGWLSWTAHVDLHARHLARRLTTKAAPTRGSAPGMKVAAPRTKPRE